MEIGFSFIGTPDGFQHSSFGVAKDIVMRWKVDLDNLSINIHPNTDILMVKREVVENALFSYIVLYKFANEISHTRSGSFYGSTLVLKNCVPNGNYGIINFLNRLAEYEREQCIDSNNRFTSSIIDLKPRDDLQYEVSLANLLEETTAKQYNLSKKCFLKFEENQNDIYEESLKMIFRSNSFDEFGVIYSSNNSLVYREALKHDLQIKTISSATGFLSSEKLLPQDIYATTPTEQSSAIIDYSVAELIQDTIDNTVSTNQISDDFMVDKPIIQDSFQNNIPDKLENNEQVENNLSESNQTATKPKDESLKIQVEKLFEDIKLIGKTVKSQSKLIYQGLIKISLLILSGVLFLFILVIFIFYFLIPFFNPEKKADLEINDKPGTIYYLEVKKSKQYTNEVFTTPSELASFLTKFCQEKNDGLFAEVKKKIEDSIILENSDIITKSDSNFPNGKHIKFILPDDYKCKVELLSRDDFDDRKPVIPTTPSPSPSPIPTDRIDRDVLKSSSIPPSKPEKTATPNIPNKQKTTNSAKSGDKITSSPTNVKDEPKSPTPLLTPTKEPEKEKGKKNENNSNSNNSKEKNTKDSNITNTKKGEKKITPSAPSNSNPIKNIK